MLAVFVEDRYLFSCALIVLFVILIVIEEWRGVLPNMIGPQYEQMYSL